MRGLRLRRLARLATGACMLLVAQGFGAPASAWAGCGHPAGSQSDPFRELRRLDAVFLVPRRCPALMPNCLGFLSSYPQADAPAPA